MKTFKFTCKENQEETVKNLLKQFGQPKTEEVGGYPVVSVVLPENVSKRSVDKYLFNQGVPGANPRKNNNPVIRIKSLEEFFLMFPSFEKRKVFYQGRFQTIWWEPLVGTSNVTFKNNLGEVLK